MITEPTIGDERPTIPFQITFRDIESSNFIWLAIQKRIGKLERLYSRILECDVVVSSPHRHHHKGKIYHLQIHLRIPGQDIIINKEAQKDHAHEDVYVTIRDAFDALERKLESHVQKMRNEIKNKEPEPRGQIIRIFPQSGYGFLKSPDGREIYFDQRSVTHGSFENLNVGQEVRYNEEMGENGPQASSLQSLNKRERP